MSLSTTARSRTTTRNTTNSAWSLLIWFLVNVLSRPFDQAMGIMPLQGATDVHAYIKRLGRAVKYSHEIAAKRRRDAFVRQSARYNRRHRSERYEIGDEVLLFRKRPIEYGLAEKLVHKEEGPFRIIEVLNDGMDYRLADEDGNSNGNVYNVERLRRYNRRVIEEEDIDVSDETEEAITLLEQNDDDDDDEDDHDDDGLLDGPIDEDEIIARPQRQTNALIGFKALQHVLQSWHNQLTQYQEEKRLNAKLVNVYLQQMRQTLGDDAGFIKRNSRQKYFRAEIRSLGKSGKAAINYLQDLIDNFDDRFEPEIVAILERA